MVCPPVTSEAGARRPRSISNFGGLCQTRKTPTLDEQAISKVWPMLSIFDSNKQKTPLEISVVFDRRDGALYCS
jgi:hypothetical protein